LHALVDIYRFSKGFNRGQLNIVLILVQKLDGLEQYP